MNVLFRLTLVVAALAHTTVAYNIDSLPSLFHLVNVKAPELEQAPTPVPTPAPAGGPTKAIAFDHNSQDAAQLVDNLAYLKSIGFTDIRTYAVGVAGGNLGTMITSLGLNATLTIPFPENPAETQAAIEAVHQSATSPGKIKTIVVGNENFAKDKSGAEAMIELVQRLKAKVPGVQIGTSQRVTEFLDASQLVPGMNELVAALDVVGVNIHPIFTPNTPAERATQVAIDQYTATLNTNYPGIANKLFITEIGYPTGGEVSGNHGSVDGARMFYQQISGWSRQLPRDTFFFQAFDTPYKTWSPIEQNYGILTSKGQPKWNL